MDCSADANGDVHPGVSEWVEKRGGVVAELTC